MKQEADGPPQLRRRNSKRRKHKRKKRPPQRSESGKKFFDAGPLSTLETEGDEELSEQEDESEPDLKQTLSIFWDVIKNRNLQIWFVYNFTCKAASSINNNVSSVYLTNDLGFPKETLSLIQVICTPLNIMFAVVSGYLASGKPFRLQSWNLIAGMAVNTYGVLVLLRTFPP